MTNKTEIAELISYCREMIEDDVISLKGEELTKLIGQIEAEEARIAELESGKAFYKAVQYGARLEERAERAEAAAGIVQQMYNDSQAELAALHESSLIEKDRLEADLNKHMDDCDELRKELAAIQGAAVPVAYMHHSGQVITREESHDDKVFAICCKVETPLFKHPAPVVVLPKPLTTKLAYLRMTSNHLSGSYRDGFNDCLTRCIQAAADTGITVKSADGEG